MGEAGGSLYFGSLPGNDSQGRCVLILSILGISLFRISYILTWVVHVVSVRATSRSTPCLYVLSIRATMDEDTS